MFKSFQVILKLIETSLQPGKEGASFSILSVFQISQAVDIAFNYILLNQEQEIVQLMHHFLSGEICIL